MRRLSLALLAAVSTIALTQFASAADLPVRAPVYKAPVMVPVYDWTGFYVGGNVGYSWGRSSTDGTLTNAATGALIGTGSDTNNLNGVIGGGQIGYNWQITNWVLGIEADIQGSGQKGSSSAVCVGCGDGPSNITTSLDQKLTWFGTVRGRLGMTVTPTILAYVTGGLAYGEVTTDGTISGPTVATPSGTATFSASSTNVGWTIGGGVEGVISGHWTAKLEYLYMDLGTVSGGPYTTPILGTTRNPLAASFSSKVTDNIVRVGINYKF
jgi:outer membrane immunogenic protein